MLDKSFKSGCLRPSVEVNGQSQKPIPNDEIHVDLSHLADKKEKMDVVLAEYNALREELIDKTRLHIRIYTIYMAALAFFYTSIFVHKIYDIIVIVPIISITLLFRLIWEQLIITKISYYIKFEIEEQKIPILIGKLYMDKEAREGYSNLWLGWQHSYWKIPPPKFYEYSVIMLFPILSVLPASLYNVYCIQTYYLTKPIIILPLVTYLPLIAHIILLMINLWLVCYMWEIIENHIINRFKTDLMK